MLARLTAFSLRRSRTVVALWVSVIALAFVAAPSLFDRLTTEAGVVDGSESQQADAKLWQADPSGETLYAAIDGRAASGPDLRSDIASLAAEVEAIPGVVEVATPWSGQRPGEAADPRAVSDDGNAIALTVALEPSERGEEAVDDVASVLHAFDAPRVLVGGGPMLDDAMDEQAASDLARAELISTPVLLVLLLIVFGGVLAAGLPLIVAFVAVASALGALFAFSLVTEVSVYSINIVTMLGLGLAVDYALLLVSRFREERALRDDVTEAIVSTMSTAGRTVAFSGLTVAVSLAGLIVVPDDLLRSTGLAGMAVVLFDMLAALTLVPALLRLAGHRIKPARSRSGSSTLARVASAAMARPVVTVVAVVGVLVLAGLPFLGARFADPDERSLPASSESRQLAELAESRFSAVQTVDPITVVGKGTAESSARDAYISELASIDGVETVSARSNVPGLTVIDVVPKVEDESRATEIVRDVRSVAAPMPVEVTGDAAELVDYEDVLTKRIPYAIGLVAIATFVLLFAFTGSVLIPLKALAMNTLSLGASFGALVYVFQEGHFGGLVGTDALGSLSITTPTLVFAIAFGLSMDYEVFLLGRITEAYQRTGDTREAVVTGIRSTGTVVTAAAALMIVVYLAFVAGGFSPVKQVGLGLAVAIAVDATLVRMLLLPAAMAALGRWNWWAPEPLRRIHHRIALTEPSAEAMAPSETVRVG